ncbi:MAG: hypothetical protein KGZ25_11260 [Planctomycetes bacterium]|nr:hypothetical protein [Planctomycetota bacterium]
MNRAGYPDLWDPHDTGVLNLLHIRRNSDGSELRICNDQDKVVLVVSAKGKVQEVPVPGVPAWLNDAHELVMWRERGPDGCHEIVHYKDGSTELDTSGLSIFQPGPRALYFQKKIDALGPQRSEKYQLFSVNNPRKVQKVLRRNYKIMSTRRDELILMGCDSPQPQQQIVMCTISIREDGLLGEKQRTIIDIGKNAYPAACWAPVTMCPWSREVLLRSHRDFPSFGSLYYVFDIDARKLKYVGRAAWAVKRWNFWLQEDILGNYGHSGRDRKGD